MKKNKENYVKVIGTPEHKKIKARKIQQQNIYLGNFRGSPKQKIKFKTNRNLKKSFNRNDGFMERVNAFKIQIQEGSDNICIACNRCLHRMSVSRFRFHSYKDLNEDMFYLQSHNGELYICLMCDRILKKNVYTM